MSPMRTRSYLLIAAQVVALASIGILGGGVQPAFAQRLARLSDTAPASIAPPAPRAADPLEGVDYDPWESFNEKTFWFNHDVLDHYGLKPAATVWQKIVPEPVRQSLANAFDNLAMPDRFVNLVLQGRLEGAGGELARFVINTTGGIAGLFDVAARVGLKKNGGDMGQTLAVYGVRPGPYLMLPFLPPLTVRDGVGYGVDSVLDPLSYFVTPIVANIGEAAVKTVNERAANLKLYQDAEDVSIDLYAAVRNGYLQRRRKSIQDAIADRRSHQDELNDLPLPASQPADPGEEQAQPAPGNFAR